MAETHRLDGQVAIVTGAAQGIGRGIALVLSEAGAKIVAVTDIIVSPAARHAGHTIVTTNESPSFYHSFTGALAVIQALIALLVTKAGGDAVKIVAEAEKQLSRISAYW